MLAQGAPLYIIIVLHDTVRPVMDIHVVEAVQSMGIIAAKCHNICLCASDTLQMWRCNVMKCTPICPLGTLWHYPRSG